MSRASDEAGFECAECGGHFPLHMEGADACYCINCSECPECGCPLGEMSESERLYLSNRIDQLEGEPYEPWTPDQPLVEVDYYEYVCGMPCEPSGCPGHVTDLPIGFTYKGFYFEVEGYGRGDFPTSDQRVEKDYQAAFEEMIAKLEGGKRV